MPLYEYACQSCQREFELLVRGSEVPECPHCGSGQLDKQLSVPAAHVAGHVGSLPVCSGPEMAGCGMPQCGGGHCALQG